VSREKPNCPVIMRRNGRPFLSGKVAIVVGASGGIGASVTWGLLRNGASVCGTFNRNRKSLSRLLSEFGPRRLLAVSLDLQLSNYADAIQDVVNTVIRKMGHIDIVIYAVGTWLVKPFLYETAEESEGLWRLNYEGARAFMMKAIPHMMRSGGQIINIASTAGIRAPGHETTYSASKAALIALTMSVSEEFAGRHIRCNVVSPDITDTPALSKYLDSHSKRALLRGIPSGRFCAPSDVADAILAILCSEYLVGVNLVVSGGRMR